MSFAALAWASSLRVTRASDKLVLLALADRHNPENELAYPSLAWLCEFSSLDRKTVVASLDRLERDSLITDSGVRVGKTKQIKAYRLSFNGAEKGTVKIGGQYLNTLEYQRVDGIGPIKIDKGNLANDYGFYEGSMSNHDKVYENLLIALKNPAHAFASAEDGMKTVEIIEKIYASCI